MRTFSTMNLTNVQLLLVVNFLYYLSSGFIKPVLTTHILRHGGNQITLGLLISSRYVCNKISRDFVALFAYTNKSAIAFCVISSGTTYLALLLSYNPWLVFVDRSVHALINQVNWFTQEYGLRNRPSFGCFKLLCVVKVAGTVIGSLTGGYFYHTTRWFSIVVLTATLVTLLALIVLRYVNPDVKCNNEQEKSWFFLTKYFPSLENLQKAKYKQNWDKIVVIVVYTFSFNIYFSRFIFLLVSKFKAGTATIGQVLAYFHLLQFLCNFFAPVIKSQVKNKKALFEYSLAVCAFSLYGVLYAPTVDAVCVICLPMMVTYTLVNSLLKDDVMKLRPENLADIVGTIKILVNIVGPVCFGILCHFFGRRAFYVIVVFPCVVCLYLLYQGYLEAKEQRRREDQ
ncbi:uncharacterized protein LOC135129493 isoform X2 [Zophobas morio]|uniref:uncharacterized protein LOC135129493 isoform X2 n=1 Tax=Zophobas morio TaxID=2755281 RepID=UPI00308374F9